MIDFIKELFFTALDTHYAKCEHLHSEGDFNLRAINTLGTGNIMYKICHNKNDLVEVSLSPFVSGDNVISEMEVAFKKIDKIIFPNRLVEILEGEIPY